MAQTEPPGRHRSSTGPPPERSGICFRSFLTRVSLIRIAPGLFQTGSGDSSVANDLEPSSFSLAASRPYEWASLRHLPVFAGRRRSPAARLGYARNPWSIQAEPEPPGRHPTSPRLPASVELARHRGFFRWLRWSDAFPARAGSRDIPFILTESQALMGALPLALDLRPAT